MRLTLSGMYNYDNRLFDYIVVPGQINKEVLINRIMYRCGELYPYCQNHPELKSDINFWFLAKQRDFEMMVKALFTDYNPLENYDRYEDNVRVSVNSGKDVTKTDTASATSDSSGSSGTAHTTDHSDASSTGMTSAFNEAEDFSNREKTVNEGDATNDVTSSSETSSRGEASSHSTNETQHGLKNDNHELIHAHGNIGTTKNTEMASDEVQLRSNYNIYDTIARLFEREFCVQVY